MLTDAVTKSSKNLNLSFDKLLKKMQDGSLGLRSLEQLFDETSNILDYTSRSFQGINLDFYLKASSRSKAIDSFRNAIRIISSDIPLMSQELISQNQILTVEVLEPLQKFISDYHKSSSQLAKEGKLLLAELTESRAKAEEQKDVYFRTASRMEKAQTALQGVILAIEKGNFSLNSMLTPRTRIILNDCIMDWIC